MCLVAIAWQVHPRYPFLLLGNRDEFHQRATAPADWWPDAPQVFGGRDLQAGGSWLGATREGRVAVVTNNPLRPPTTAHARSRGALVRDWLAGTASADEFLGAIEARLSEYAGFSLLVGSIHDGLKGLVTPAGSLGARWTVPRGVTALSNAPRETPWAKAGWLASAVETCLNRVDPDKEPESNDLLALLERRMPVAHPESGSLAARARVTPFISGVEYGTRASSLIIADAAGGWRFIERRFGPGGMPAGESQARQRG